MTGGSRPTARIATTALVGGENLDTVTTPDGLHAIFVSPYLEGHQVVQWASLAPAGLAASDRLPAAVAVRSDGLVAKGVALLDVDFVPGPRHRFDVAVSRSALGPTVGYLHLPPAYEHTLSPAGLSFGNSRLFVVYKTGSTFTVTVRRMPALRKLSFTTDRARYPRGGTLHAVAHLDPSLPGRHRTVSVYSRPDGSAHRTLLTRRSPNRLGNVTADLSITRRTRISVVVHTSRGTWRTYRIRTVA